ncbi:uncharacterized protein LOC118403257 [Branchiostoma floridae]|uniref:Uncharacterized protein LOC118403257 n=1 Tax=Branchiostoma floridae TaxID=7739 RepID=A0A9J7KFH7_BRAFL|nr:uncharacterized protein LOC118403257 [Branchiostoma floridae]XP_035657759.1 uncharacterized protein LOC118403257 [Branchiostoma floridae]XP_035657760.1 uncharacterized protein LOC118403257 [Branchiostoma floridae]
MTSSRRDVFVLIPFHDVDQEKAEVLRRCPDVQVKDVIFSNIDDNETLLEYTERVKKVVTERDINIILPTSDLSTFVHAAITKDFPHIPGPSVESCFLAFHKAYTRQYLDPTENPPPYDVVDLNSPTMLEDAGRALKKVGLPAFVKPAAGSDTFGVRKLKSLEDLMLALQDLKAMGDKNPNFIPSPGAAFFRDYFKLYLDVEKYPLALRDVAIVEPYLDALANCTVDGCVVDKRVVHWPITDQIRFDDQDAKFAAAISPSSEPEDVQARMREVYDGVMDRMVRFGFNHGFTNIEVFKMKDGQLRLCEVNARGSKQLQTIYKASHSNVNQDYVYLTAGSGIRPVLPTETGRYGIAYPVRFRVLDRPGNLVHFDQIEKLKQDPDANIRLVAGPDDDVTSFAGSAGNHFMYLHTYGDTREAMIRKMADVLQVIVKKPELLTYPIHYGM